MLAVLRGAVAEDCEAGHRFEQLGGAMVLPEAPHGGRKGSDVATDQGLIELRDRTGHALSAGDSVIHQRDCKERMSRTLRMSNPRPLSEFAMGPLSPPHEASC